MGYEYVVVARDEGVGIITLNRPEVLNALNRDLLGELDTALAELEGDTETRAIIVTGRGDGWTCYADEVMLQFIGEGVVAYQVCIQSDYG